MTHNPNALPSLTCGRFELDLLHKLADHEMQLDPFRSDVRASGREGERTRIWARFVAKFT